MTARAELARVVGPDATVQPFAAGLAGPLFLVRSPDGTERVAKTCDAGDGGLEIEAASLRALAPHAPVPAVHHASPHVLLMDRVPGAAGCPPAAEPHAAEVLARLHAVRGPRFGFDGDTRLGGLVQPNPWRDSWCAFFAEARLLPFAAAARDAGRLDAGDARAVERLAARLTDWIDEPAHPALLHGDLWSGNVLTDGARVTGLVDPAVHYGHPEVELAFTTLFSTFTERFYREYGERAGAPLERDFFEERRHVYNVYPLLVHVHLFGAAYTGRLRAVLARFAG